MPSQIKKQKDNRPEFQLIQNLKDTFGFSKIIGLDEVGRGAIAGPLVVAAVELETAVDGIRDSKQLSALNRGKVFQQLVRCCNQISLGIVSNKEIDQLGLTAAQNLAYQRALDKISGDIYLTDFVKLPNRYKVIRAIKGDNLFYPVAAASIVAKVYRDQLMKSYHQFFPHYHWKSNVGYGSSSHCQAVDSFGLSPIHRETFIK